MSVAWDVIRIKHGLSSSRRLDKRDRRLTADYQRTFREFEEIDRQLKTFKEKKEPIPPKLAQEHHALFERIENLIHKLIIDEHSELLRDIDQPLRCIKVLYHLFDKALNHPECGQKTKVRIGKVLEAASTVETVLEELASTFMDDSRGLLGESRNMGFIRGYNVRDEDGVLASLRRRDNWKIKADAKLKEYSEAVEAFVKKVGSLHADKKLAAIIGYNFEKMEMSNFVKLTTLMTERARIAKDILHYYVNLYHKYKSYQLNAKEELELHHDERGLSIVFKKMYNNIESTLSELKKHRKIIVRKVLNATTGLMLALQVLTSTAMAASPGDRIDMRSKALSYAKQYGQQVMLQTGSSQHKFFQTEKNGVRLLISEDGSQLVVEYQFNKSDGGSMTAVVGDNDNDIEADKVVLLDSGMNIPSHVRLQAELDALSGNDVESAATTRELESSFAGFSNEPGSSVIFAEKGIVVNEDGSVVQKTVEGTQSLANGTLSKALAQFNK